MSSSSSELTPLRLAWAGLALAGLAVALWRGEALWQGAGGSELLAQATPGPSTLWPLLRDTSPFVRLQAAASLAR